MIFYSQETAQTDNSNHNSKMVVAAVTILYIFIPICLFTWIASLLLFTHNHGPSVGEFQPLTPTRLLLAILIPIYMGYRGLKKKSLSISGVLSALWIGFILTSINYCFITSMLAFFISGSAATKYRMSEKSKFEKNTEQASARNWVQVLCNGGVATIMAMFYYLDAGCREIPIDFDKQLMPSWWCIAVLASICSSAGDTLASELGPVLPFSEPYLITTFKPVPKGTNGGVSLSGTVCSIIAGLIVSSVYYITLVFVLSDDQIVHSPPQWPLLLIGALSGFIGSMIDSILGANLQFSGQDTEDGCIVEYRGDAIRDITSAWAILDNHSVNLITSIIISIIIPKLAATVWYQVSLYA